MDFNVDLVIQSFPLLLLGAGITIKITALSVAVGIVIGLFMGIARIGRIKLFRWIAAVYVDFFRGTPLLIQIFLVYFACLLNFEFWKFSEEELIFVVFGDEHEILEL